MPSTYPNFLNKGKTPFECMCQIGSTTFRFFVDACENLIIADDVVMPLNPPVAPVEKEKLEDAPFDKSPFDINVSQWSHEEKPSKRVVRTWIDRSA